MTHVACDSRLCSAVARSSIHPGEWGATGCAVVYYARAVQAFSAGSKCRPREYLSTFNDNNNIVI